MGISNCGSAADGRKTGSALFFPVALDCSSLHLKNETIKRTINKPQRHLQLYPSKWQLHSFGFVLTTAALILFPSPGRRGWSFLHRLITHCRTANYGLDMQLRSHFPPWKMIRSVPWPLPHPISADKFRGCRSCRCHCDGGGGRISWSCACAWTSNRLGLIFTGRRNLIVRFLICLSCSGFERFQRLWLKVFQA